MSGAGGEPWSPGGPAPSGRGGRPRPYPQVLRGPAHRWWRPLVGLVVVAAVVVTVVVVLDLAVGVLDLVAGSGTQRGAVPAPVDTPAPTTPLDLIGLNLSVAAFLPLSLLAVRVGHRWRPGFLSSVLGRLRWRWLGRAVGVCVVVLVPVATLLSLLGGVLGSPHEPHWALVLGAVLLTTPLQAASEEYVFRGWLNQAVGSLFGRPRVAVAAGALVSSTLFAIAHGGQDGWLFADRWVFGMAAAVLAWRTGGLEAGIALHTTFNLVAWAQAVAFGSLTETVDVSSMPPTAFVLDTAQLALVTGFLLWSARRARVARLFVPRGGAGG